MKNLLFVVSFFSFFFSACLDEQALKRMHWDTTGEDVLTDGGGEDVWGKDTADETSRGVEFRWGFSPPIPPAVVEPACMPTDCNDSNACTDDTCDPAMGCVFTNNTATCDDGDACTTGDTCTDDTCMGTAIDCDDRNACTADSCFSASGCVHKALPGCGDVAVVVDLCVGLDCNDGNLCTDDACDPATGCVFTLNMQPCNDGNACTASDACSNGTCGGTAVDCNDGNACTDDACDPTTGCVYTNNTKPCDDGDAYTDDACDPATGCIHTSIEISCESLIGVEFTGIQLWGVKNFSVKAGIKSEAYQIAADPCCKKGQAVDIYITPPFENLEAVGYLLPEGNSCEDFFKCRHICGFLEGKSYWPIVQYTPPKDCACWNDVPAWSTDGPIYPAPPP